MNFKALAERIGLDEDEYRELVELLLETGRGDYDHIKAAFKSGDAQQVARYAHALSGAAGNLGIMNVHEVAKRIELAAAEDQLDSISGEVDALKGHFDRIAERIHA